MDPKILTAILVIIAILAVVAVLFVTRRRKTEHLKQKFGSEYDRVVHQHGDPQRAETVLAARERRVSHFELRTLPPTERERYAQQWAFVQRKFVDDPKGAVNEADRLVTDIVLRHGRGQSSTEDLRKAMVHFRSLFDELLGTPGVAHKEVA